MSLRIAIATATPHEKCETFVAAHINRLKDVVLVLTDGLPPERDGTGRSLWDTSRWDVITDRVRTMVLGQDRAARTRRKITDKLRAARVDVVLAEYGVTAAEMLPCCTELGIPLVAYFLGFDAYQTKVLERYNGYRDLFAGAATLIAVSRSMREQLIALGAPPHKVVYNSCGAEFMGSSANDPASAPPHFVAVGRFVDKKAPQLTLLAFERVLRKRPDARLTMVGDGELWESCHQLVRAHGIGHAVDLCGTRSPMEIAALLQRSRAFVQHSVITGANDREGTPVAMLEAMAAGVPVIATRHGDIVELVAHGERGLLCEERDVEGMAAHMVHLIDDPAEATRLGRAGSTYVQAEHGQADRIADLQRILVEATMHKRT